MNGHSNTLSPQTLNPESDNVETAILREINKRRSRSEKLFGVGKDELPSDATSTSIPYALCCFAFDVGLETFEKLCNER